MTRHGSAAGRPKVARDRRPKADTCFPDDGDGPRGTDEAGHVPIGPGGTRWLLIRGRGDRPLEPKVDRAAICVHGSSRRPAVEPGDLCILYAAVWQAIFGIAEVTGEPDHDPAKERWAWRFPIRPLAVVDELDGAPAVEEAGIFPQSIWRHSHIRLSAEQFEQACRLIQSRLK